MKAASYARILFGASAVLFGIVELIWRDSDMWQFLRPLGMAATLAAWCLAIAQIGGGIGLFSSRSARYSWIVLGAVYLVFSVVCIPGMVAAPLDKGPYVNFFEKFSLVCGAVAGYAVTLPAVTQAASLARIARIALGICALSFAWAQVVYLQYTASLVPAWIPPNQMFWTILTTVAFAVAAVAMLIDRQAILATDLMALMMALFGILVWIPRIAGHPHDLSNWNEITDNYLMTGAAWMVAGALRLVRAPVFEPVSAAPGSAPATR